MSIVAIDLEMTGLDLVADRICEVGLAWGAGGRLEGSWSALVDPGVPMNPEAQAVHGIEAADVQGAPTFGVIAQDLARRLDGCVAVAHRAEVDRGFLTAAFVRAGVAPPAWRWYDTLSASRAVLRLRRHRLSDVCDALGVTRSSHRALSDAQATFAVWTALCGWIDPDAALSTEAFDDRLAAFEVGSAWRKDLRARLRDGLARRRVVHLRYVSLDEAGRAYVSDRDVEIWKVRPPRVEGFCRLRGERRVFHEARLHDVVVTSEPYTLVNAPRTRI